MALISCPECNKQISDKAISCPNCGFPINNPGLLTSENVTLYDVEFKGFYNHYAYTKNRFKALGYIQKITNRYNPEAEHINRGADIVIFKGVSLCAADIIKQRLGVLGCDIAISPSDEKAISQFESSILDSTVLRCPRCHSNSVTTGTKGYGLIRGFLGSNKTVNRCGSCGYSWEP